MKRAKLARVKLTRAKEKRAKLARQTALLDSSVQGPGPARPAVTNCVECLFIIEVVILPNVVKPKSFGLNALALI